MSFPYNFNEELLAIHREKLAADGVDLSAEELQITLDARRMQFSFILGRKFGSCGVDPEDQRKVTGILEGKISYDASILKAESVVAEAMIQARLEFRHFLGLEFPKQPEH